MTKTIKEMLDQHKEEIINLYLVENISQVAIGKKFNVNPNSIFKFMKRHGIKKQRVPKVAAPHTSTITNLGIYFDVRIYREPCTHYYYIIAMSEQGPNIRDYIAKEFNSIYASMIYIIPEGFEVKFSKVTTEKNLIYPK